MHHKFHIPLLTNIARLLLLLLVIPLLGISCRTEEQPGAGPQITVWGLFDDSDMMAPFIRVFNEVPGGGPVEYRKQRPVDTYEEQLLRAFAEGRGPDVFVIHSSWIPRWESSILPAPPDIVSEADVRREFVSIVEDNVIKTGRVVGLPLFVDTLALYYNRDIFDAANVARPPSTWEEVHTIVRHVTKEDEQIPGVLRRHGITMGAGRNVNRASDILSILMMQNGAQMLDENRRPAFGSDRDAVAALQFYTDFSNIRKEEYTWNLDSDYSLDAFAEGEAAMMVNYSYHMPTIDAKNPRLNYDIAPLPQVEVGSGTQPVTYGGYWVLVVHRNSTVPHQAWRFIRFMTEAAQSRKYLEVSGYPPARRDLVEELQNDTRIGVFARQSLIAKNWRQPDSRVVDRAFENAIDAVVRGDTTVQEALSRAASEVETAARQLEERAQREGAQ